MIFSLVDFGASVLEFFICFLVCGKFAKKRFSKIPHYLLSALFSVICALAMSYLNTLSLFSLLSSVLMAVFTGSLALILFKNNRLFTYSVVFAFMVFLISLDFLVVSIIELWGKQLNFTLEMMTNLGYPRMYYIFFMKLLLVIFYICFSFFVKPQNNHKISAKISILTFIFCGMFCMCVNYLINAIIIGDVASIQQSVIVAWFCMVISVVFAMIILSLINKSNISRQEVEFVTMQQNMLEKSHEQLQSTYKATSKNYHDFKNHILTIQTMLNNNQVDSAKEYINRFADDFSVNGYSIYTGSEMVDALLNNKVALAKSKNIAIDIASQFNVIEKSKSVDICSVLANLLDNAIEASENEQEKQITVDIKKVHEMLIISVKNKLSHSPFINGRLITSKPDKIMHGIGLKSIQMTVEKYDGEQNQKFENNWFVSSVMI